MFGDSDHWLWSVTVLSLLLNINKQIKFNKLVNCQLAKFTQFIEKPHWCHRNVSKSLLSVKRFLLQVEADTGLVRISAVASGSKLWHSSADGSPQQHLPKRAPWSRSTPEEKIPNTQTLLTQHLHSQYSQISWSQNSAAKPSSIPRCLSPASPLVATSPSWHRYFAALFLVCRSL